MRIKIFQMESSERTYGKKFFGLPKDGVDPTLYKNVYYGDVEAESLEEVYSMFNDNRPYTFHGHCALPEKTDTKLKQKTE